jgi:hypothetical protein
MARLDLDPGREALLRALTQAKVAFVVIGGAALQSYDQSHRTDDIDVTPEHSHGNLARLATVLNTLNCKLVIDPADDSQDVPLPAGYFTAQSLARHSIWNLQTAHGKLDITFHPSGFPAGYEQLRLRRQTARGRANVGHRPRRGTRRRRAFQTHGRSSQGPRLPHARRPRASAAINKEPSPSPAATATFAA